jgi:esterase/lipase
MDKKSNLFTDFENQLKRVYTYSCNTCILICSLLLLICNASSEEKKDSLPKEYSRTAVNAYNEGGVLKKWLILGPFQCPSENDTLQQKVIKHKRSHDSCFAKDYIRQIGSENATYIQNTSFIYLLDFNRVRKVVKPKQFTVDSLGFICLDALLAKGKQEVLYAFCLVEAFVQSKVRCFWGVDGRAKVWVNGKEMQNEWNITDSCLPLSKYFTTEFKQGMNSILLKLTNDETHCRFTLEIYDHIDSLIPFTKRIELLTIDLNNHEQKTDKDSISAQLRFNIQVPENTFDGIVYILRNTGDTLRYIPIDVGEAFTIKLPDTVQGLVQISADVKIEDDRQISSTRYIWKGNYSNSLKKQIKRFKHLKGKVNNNNKADSFVTTLIKGAYAWVKDWFAIVDSLGTDEKIRQLGLVQLNGNLIEELLSGQKLKGNSAYPLLLSIDLKEGLNKSTEYDPSRWLNYKYPEKYALPEEIKGVKNYPFWMYLPGSATKQRKKVPIILSLHGAGDRGYNINRVKDFGASAYAETISSFPFAIVTPQCRFKTLWDSRVLKKILDVLLRTGRFDENRVYITGIGMGGFTAWHLACSYPDYFAAVAPVNSSGNKDKACTIKKMPVWAFHGVKNRLVPVEESQKMITTLKECKAPNVEFSIYTEYGQDISSIVYKNQKFYKWLIKQKR